MPTEDQEEKRALIRYHRQIMADRGRCEARGKGLLCAQGIEVHGRWWHGEAWLEVQSDPRLKDWMKEQLIGWRNKILSTDEEQGGLRERIAALARRFSPKESEPIAPRSSIRDERFRALYQSAPSGQHHGFMSWDSSKRWSRQRGLDQPLWDRDCALDPGGDGMATDDLAATISTSARLAAGLVKGKRAKKRLVVQAARRLAIDLWRLSTGQTTPEKLGLIMHDTSVK